MFWPEEKGKELLYTWRTEFFGEAINPLRKHYLNYLSFEYCEDRCDVLAHLLAILFNIPDQDKTKKILKYLLERKISNPYPVKVLNPPIFYPNPTWNPKNGSMVKPENQWELDFNLGALLAILWPTRQ